ncbi:hypothetical protein DOTSEDRAFT_78645, partial [Dothistroma septosporum NZE10]
MNCSALHDLAAVRGSDLRHVSTSQTDAARLHPRSPRTAIFPICDMQLALTTLKKPQLALGICRCCDRYLRHLVHESKQPINTLGTQGQGVLNGELVDTLASTPTPTPMPPTILLSLHAGRDPSRSSAPRPTHARTSTTHHHESPMIEHGSPPTVHPPFPYNFGQTTRRQSSVPRGLGTLENMDDFSFEQAMAE